MQELRHTALLYERAVREVLNGISCALQCDTDLRQISVVYTGKTRCGANYSYTGKRYENINVSCVLRKLNKLSF